VDGFCVDHERYRGSVAISLPRMNEHFFALFQEVASNLSARYGTVWITDGNFRPRSTEFGDFIQRILNIREFS
jgi:hypothetical protein